jgi:hypothetical protein
MGEAGETAQGPEAEEGAPAEEVGGSDVTSTKEEEIGQKTIDEYGGS